MKEEDKTLEQLKCPLCKDVDAGFIIFPENHKKMIKWDCGHSLYRDGQITKKKV